MERNPLLAHIQDQQGRMAVLREILKCLGTLESYNVCEDLRLGMAREAEELAAEVEQALDIVNLPKMEDAA